MLEADKIPLHEPSIRVGIILPEDEQKSVEIRSENTFSICGTDKNSLVEGGQIKIFIEGDQLRSEPEFIGDSLDEIKLELEDRSGYFEVLKVRAGRAFHWEKMIRQKLSDILIIRAFHGSLILINELPLEKYLACVATSEMSAECPMEFIKAQTIVARSWMLANVEKKHVHLGFDVCNDDCCQRYQGLENLSDHALSAAEQTRGKVLIFGDKICDARYSKSCGGIMEKFENLWEYKPLPYMKNLIDAKDLERPDLSNEETFVEWIRTTPETYCSPHFIPESKLTKYLGKVDEEAKYFRWEKSVSQTALLENINHHLKLHATAILSLKTLSRGGSGRMLAMEIKYIDISNEVLTTTIYKDYEIRKILDPDFLFSSACLIEAVYSGSLYPNFKYTGGGWGHGAGMCQIGALGMSLDGSDVTSILRHYYPGSELKKIYD